MVGMVVERGMGKCMGVQILAIRGGLGQSRGMILRHPGGLSSIPTLILILSVDGRIMIRGNLTIITLTIIILISTTNNININNINTSMMVGRRWDGLVRILV